MNGWNKLIWSPECDNPDKGFTIQPDGSMKMNAPKGYYVMTTEEAREKLWNKNLI